MFTYSVCCENSLITTRRITFIIRVLQRKCPSDIANLSALLCCCFPLYFYAIIPRISTHFANLARERPEFEFSCEHLHLCCSNLAELHRSNCFYCTSHLFLSSRRSRCAQLFSPNPSRARKTPSQPRKARKQKTCNRKTNCFCCEITSALKCTMHVLYSIAALSVVLCLQRSLCAQCTAINDHKMNKMRKCCNTANRHTHEMSKTSAGPEKKNKTKTKQQ